MYLEKSTLLIKTGISKAPAESCTPCKKHDITCHAGGMELSQNEMESNYLGNNGSVITDAIHLKVPDVVDRVSYRKGEISTLCHFLKDHCPQPAYRTWVLTESNAY